MKREDPQAKHSMQFAEIVDWIICSSGIWIISRHKLALKLLSLALLLLSQHTRTTGSIAVFGYIITYEEINCWIASFDFDVGSEKNIRWFWKLNVWSKGRSRKSQTSFNRGTLTYRSSARVSGIILILLACCHVWLLILLFMSIHGK